MNTPLVSDSPNLFIGEKREGGTVEGYGGLVILILKISFGSAIGCVWPKLDNPLKTTKCNKPNDTANMMQHAEQSKLQTQQESAYLALGGPLVDDPLDGVLFFIRHLEVVAVEVCVVE